jgi:hypothetical protein
MSVIGSIKERFVITETNIDNLTVNPNVFDILDISDAMNFKDNKSAYFTQRLEPLKHVNVGSLKQEGVQHILKQQIGSYYNVMFYKEHDDHIDVVVQRAEKMYGIYLTIPRHGTWEPRFKGFIFDDKINMLANEYVPLTDFRTWPFEDDLKSRPLEGA